MNRSLSVIAVLIKAVVPDIHSGVGSNINSSAFSLMKSLMYFSASLQSKIAEIFLCAFVSLSPSLHSLYRGDCLTIATNSLRHIILSII